MSTLQTDRTVLQELANAYLIVKSGTWDGPVPWKLKEAICVVLSSGVAPQNPDGLREILNRPRADYPKDRPLLSPYEIDSMYGLDQPLPPIPTSNAIDEWRSAGLRLICILIVNGWQRHESLIESEVQHILVGRTSTEFLVVWAKTGHINRRIPCWAMFPEADVEFMKEFRSRALVAGFSPDTRLTELAGLSRYVKAAAKEAHQAFCARMTQDVEAFGKARSSTHIARATGLSWAPMRALLVHYPDLRNHPLMDDYRDHWSFTPEALNRFKQIIPGEATDSVEIYRRIAGWTTPREFFRSYCRNWHLLLSLHRARLSRESFQFPWMSA
jgi:DNA-binding phage protein